MTTFNRRRFLRTSVAGSLALTMGGAVRFSSLWAAEPAEPIDFDAIPGLSPAVTPNEDFYLISKNVFDPSVEGSTWALQVEGEVTTPLTLTEAQIRELPAVELYLTLECISNEVGGDLIGNALWRGVRLGDLLRRAGVSDGARKVRFECADGYSTAIPVEKAMDSDTLLAYDMNGVPLPPRHGYPLRLINPGHYGMKNPKWIEKIQLVSEDYLGYWEQRGWSDAAVIKTMSRIDIPESGAGIAAEARWVAGVALAGARGIDAVELSTDNGKAWRQAALEEPLSRYTWRRWALLWEPAGPGEHLLIVRATDGTGALQTEETADTLPDGASGRHRQKLRLK